ncbi:uncharacterized protein EI90DRAFT_1256934 [Cantharellus anzutake]|uniref:uncharacterized protein n=1 Tax=Cantharellus anzutake TaxID=1750568 RepID=UPI001907D1CF|nr:uncharacterized protein EI90DRAFT_1256934 [Cantharellus anzutake]KAF8330004.1 hypothetical protein EI90DRAFT_1256934 [Cantharellus anzutake]
MEEQVLSKLAKSNAEYFSVKSNISGEFSGRVIPLSEDALIARKLMEAKLSELPNMLSGKVITGDAEFHRPDIRSGIVACTALSLDGCRVALGFGSGVIEVADIDHQRMISRFQCSPTNLPVWIEFCSDNNQIVTEEVAVEISPSLTLVYNPKGLVLFLVALVLL